MRNDGMELFLMIFGGCFIAEDENGDIEDDWIIEEFDKEDAE